jgi:hypothetical protein
MSLTHSGTQSVMLDPSSVQEMLELSRGHDQQLREMRQDLLRAETNLRTERRWSWPVLAASASAGAVALATLQIPDVMPRIRERAESSLAAAQRVLSDSFVTAGFPVPNFILAFLMIGLVAGAILLAWKFRETSPRKAARNLMERFAQGQGISAIAFSDDSIHDVAISIGILTRRHRMFPKGRGLLPTTPSLAVSVTSLLHRATDAAPASGARAEEYRFNVGGPSLLRAVSGNTPSQ